MIEFRVMPAIDLIGGKCVRLEKGDYSTSKTYEQNPVDMAKRLEDAGLRYLHIVDLDGAKSGQIVNFPVLEAIKKSTHLVVDFGGGLKKAEDLRIAFDHGANQVSVGSTAVKQPEVFVSWIQEFGPEKIILSADAKEGKVAMHAWQDVSEFTVSDFITSYKQYGIKDVVCTDISKDGMLVGPGFELYDAIMQEVSDINLIASGGIKDMDDIREVKERGMAGAIVGKAMYEGRISLKQLADFQALAI
ncbi:MAG: 1-(5-phosphoribosyl)-5-[(5-phosphoribosylamino)methylideneamino]imidazole-4-carboxamide isomerase [Bacteroidota bacterium]